MTIEQKKLAAAKKPFDIVSYFLFNQLSSGEMTYSYPTLLTEIIAHYDLPEGTHWKFIFNFIKQQYNEPIRQAAFFTPVLEKLYLKRGTMARPHDELKFFAEQYNFELAIYSSKNLIEPEEHYPIINSNISSNTAKILFDSDNNNYQLEMINEETAKLYTNSSVTSFAKEIFKSFSSQDIPKLYNDEIAEEFIKTIEQRVKNLANSEVSSDIANSNKQIFKDLIFTILEKHGFEIGALEFEICVSGSLAKKQATLYSDLDAFIIVAEKDKDKIQQIKAAMQDLQEVTLKIFEKTNQFYLDPAGINPLQFIGTVNDLVQKVTRQDDDGVLDPFIHLNAILTAAPAAGQADLLNRLKDKILEQPMFKKYKDNLARAVYFYNRVINEFPAPKELENFHLKNHIFRPLDMFMTGFRAEYNINYDDGAHLEIDRVVKDLKTNGYINQNLADTLSNTFKIAISLRNEQHNIHRGEHDYIDITVSTLDPNTKAKVEKLLDNIEIIRQETQKRVNQLSVDHLYYWWKKASTNYSFANIKSQETKVIDNLFETHKGEYFNQTILNKFSNAIDNWLKKEQKSTVSVSGRYNSILTLQKAIERRVYLMQQNGLNYQSNDTNSVHPLIELINNINSVINNKYENKVPTGIQKMRSIFAKYNWNPSTADLTTAFNLFHQLKLVAKDRTTYLDNGFRFFSSIRRSNETSSIYEKILQINPNQTNTIEQAKGFFNSLNRNNIHETHDLGERSPLLKKINLI